MADADAVVRELAATSLKVGSADLQLKQLKRAQSWFSPDVYLVETPSQRVIVKSYLRGPAVIRQSWGRYVTARERRAYGKLHGLAGIPPIVPLDHKEAVGIGFVDGFPLPSRRKLSSLPSDFFDHAIELLRSLHGRGVAHCDIRRHNILVGPAGQPYLIDFQSAVCDAPTPMRRRFFQYMCRVDLITLTKIKRKYYPDGLSPEEQALLDDAPWTLRTGRFLRRYVYGTLSPKKVRRRFRRKHRNLQKTK